MALPLLLRGNKLSLTERAASAGLSASQTPSALFPLSRLGDARPSQLFIFPLRLEDEYWHLDTDQYRDDGGLVVGGFENWTDGIPNGHTVNVTGNATVTEETTSPIFSGGSSMQLSNGTGTLEVLKSVEVLAGEQVELRYATETSVGSSPATLEIFNPYTGKWLTSSGAWSSRRQDAVSDAATTMPSTLSTLTFMVEVFSAVRNHTVSLELRYHMDQAAASQTHHWDAVRWIPAVDFVSIHAHNMSAGIEPRLVSSDADISAVPVDRTTGFGGATQIEKASDFTALSDGRTGTFSMWFRMLGGDGTDQVFIANGSVTTRRFQVRRLADDTIQIEAFDSGGTSRLTITSTGTVTADGALHHVAGSWDQDGGADDQLLFLDGVRDDTPVFAAFDIDYTTGSWVLGGYDDAAQDLNAEMAELWFDPTNNIDFKVAANLLLFRTAGGKAAMLGGNGELVNGTSPILYWRGDAASFLFNGGTGGNFNSLVGSAVTSPVTLEAELAKQDVSFYVKLSQPVKFRQFWKFHMRGLNAVDPIESGQWVIAESVTPPWSPRLQDNAETVTFAQSRAVVEASGEQWIINKAKHPRRTARMAFRLKSTQQASFKEELLARTKHGGPIVLVEDKSNPKVIYGFIPRQSEFMRRAVSNELVELVVEESSNGIGLP